MSDSHHPSEPKPSRPPLSDQLVPLHAVRRYEDAELLQRAWLRLEKTGLGADGRVQASRRRAQWALAAALFGIGIFVGRWSVPRPPFASLSPSVSSEDFGERARETAAPASLDEPEQAESPEVRGGRHRSARAVSRLKESTDESARGPSGPPDELAANGKFDDSPEGGELATDGDVAHSEPTVERARWLVLAERGDFAAAFSELDQGGTFQAVLQASSAEELMTLADVARFAGRDGRAILALRQVTERYRHDPNAPLAAMMLGNLLSRAGDREGARAAYALNRTLSPDGDFAEDALVRELDLVLAERDLERASKLLQKYETEFASGSRLETLRAQVAALRGELLEDPTEEARGESEQTSAGGEDEQDAPESERGESTSPKEQADSDETSLSADPQSPRVVESE